MDSIRVQGQIDDQHHLLVEIPDTIPPGPVTIWIATNTEEDEAGDTWMAGVAEQWAEDLRDTRQDIYTLTDGEPVDET